MNQRVVVAGLAIGIAVAGPATAASAHAVSAHAAGSGRGPTMNEATVRSGGSDVRVVVRGNTRIVCVEHRDGRGRSVPGTSLQVSQVGRQSVVLVSAPGVSRMSAAQCLATARQAQVRAQRQAAAAKAKAKAQATQMKAELRTEMQDLVGELLLP